MNALCAGKLLARSHSSSSIREHIQEKSPMNAQNVAKHSGKNPHSLYIKELTLERSLISVQNVRKPLPRNPTLLYIREPIQERNPMEEASLTSQNSICNMEQSNSVYHMPQRKDVLI